MISADIPKVRKAPDGSHVYGNSPEGALTKYCSGCKFYYPATKEFFGSSNSNRLGLSSWCRTCINKPRHSFTDVDFSLLELECRRCRVSKPATDFSFKKNVKSRFNRNYICKECQVVDRAERYSNLRDDLQDYLKRIIRSAKMRASKSGIEFSLTYEQIQLMYNTQQGKCSMSGTAMTHHSSQERMESNISIDRIDSSRGYTPDNVQLVSWRCNVIKGNMNNKELLRMCKLIIKTLES